MSVIKTNPSDTIPHLPMEGDTVSSKPNSVAFSHKNMVKKIVEAINHKKQMRLAFNKNENQQLAPYIIPSVVHLPMPQIEQLTGSIKSATMLKLKNIHPIDINSKVMGKSEILNFKNVELIMDGAIVTNKNLFSECELAADNNIEINYQEGGNNQTAIGGNKTIGDKEEINNQIAVGRHEVIGDDVVIGYRPSIIAKPIDEDDIPLFNNMMIGFSSQNTSYWEKDKLTFSGNVGHQLSKVTEHSQEQSLIMLVSEPPVESIFKKQKGQTETSPQAIKPVVNIPTQSEIKPEWAGEQLKQNVQTHNQPRNLVKSDSLKNSTTLLEQQLATHHMGEKRPAEQGSKDSIVPDIAQKFSFEKSESFMRPSISGETEELSDSKLTLLPESFGKLVNNLPNEKQKPIVSPQVTSEESIDFPSNVIATAINEMAIRPQVSPQTSQPNQAAHKTPELMENTPLLGESKEPKTVARSLTYTFNQWQSSPLVTFELASKGEFIASTQSQEVQLALNENKHLLDHENSVHVRREDERQQQHRNRQHHEQQQEED